MFSQTPPADPSRRQLIKRGAMGSLVLASASSASFLSGCASKIVKPPFNTQEHAVYQFLNRDDVLMISAIAPVIIDTHWPSEAEPAKAARDTLLQRVDTFITRLGDHNMHEIRQLFDLLNQRITRGLTTGLWAPWPQQEPAAIENFLNDWKSSRFALFNNAYNALTDIIGFSWYSAPQHSTAFGYAGPPAYLYEALPQLRGGQA
ncbi:MAG: hypothetical protein R3183_09365 [Oleiphilaceae bacterium]|nr:hypothetical protein [Oleiphilaceae bacterium]